MAFITDRWFAKILHSLAVVVLLDGCADNEPRLEVWEDGVYQPRPVSAYEITGRRDGASTTAVAMFTFESGERLQVEFKIVYDPTPALGSGHWHLDGVRGGAGEVRAESLKFLGGQGEGPSLGGRFRLDENGSPRFRVVLPLRPVDQPNWRAK